MARAVEQMGFRSLWVGGSPPGDLTHVESLVAATESIVVVTGIVNMWKDDADLAAASFRRIDTRYPGRFVLGVGIGHPEATREYDSPYLTMVDYLDRLETLGVPKQQMILAALGPRALRLSADKTAGTHPYFTSPRHTHMAREIVGPEILIAPEQTVVLDTDPATARLAARGFMKRYLQLVNYRSSLLREGWHEADFDNGGSDRLVDAIVLHGGALEVADGIKAHHAAGADNVNVQVLGSEQLAAYESLAEVLL